MSQSNNNLMKKTKTELIDIILHKDEIEEKHIEQIRDLLIKVEEFKYINAKARDYINMNKKTLDEYISIGVKLRNTIRAQHEEIDHFRTLCFITCLIIIGMTFVVIIL